MKPYIRSKNRLHVVGLCLALVLLAACDQLSGLQPTILSFTAEPSTINKGETSTLKWNILGGAEDLAVTLTPGDISLGRTDTYDASPTETTTYTLTVSDEASTVTKELTVSIEADGGGTPERIIEGDVLVTTQAELDALGGVTEITGDLDIRTQAQSLDFSPLDTLKTVGFVSFLDNPNLQEIDALPSLESASRLSIEQNPNLKSASGFNALKVADLTFARNAKLEAVSGFGALAETPDLTVSVSSLGIFKNPVLTQLPEFESLKVAGGIFISDNDALIRLPEFKNLETSRSISILDNSSLSALPSFNNLSEIVTSVRRRDGAVFIINNDSLTEITGFEGLSSLYYTTSIAGNDNLESISAFPNVNDVYSLNINDNPKLERVELFANATELTLFFLTLENLPALEKLPELGGLTDVFVLKIINSVFTSLDDYADVAFGELMLENNSALTQLSGFNFNNVDPEDAPFLTITQNNALTDITGFNRKFFEGVAITDNVSLTDISGFDGANSLVIQGNEALKDISGFNSAFTDVENFAYEDLTIEANPELTSISGFQGAVRAEDSNIIISSNTSFDCSAKPQSELGVLPADVSTGNLVDCPVE